MDETSPKEIDPCRHRFFLRIHLICSLGGEGERDQNNDLVYVVYWSSTFVGRRDEPGGRTNNYYVAQGDNSVITMMFSLPLERKYVTFPLQIHVT